MLVFFAAATVASVVAAKFLNFIHLPRKIKIGTQNARHNKDGRDNFSRAPTGMGIGPIFRCGGAESQAFDLRVVGSRSHVTDDDHDKRRNQSDQDAEILEVNIIDYP